MKTITFTCKVISPMFIGNANNSAAELRAPAMKASLRFWWRAVHPDLDVEKLKKEEAKIFGGKYGPGENDVEKGQFMFINVNSYDDITTRREQLDPREHKTRGKAFAIVSGKFDITIKLNKGAELNKIIAIFKLASALGGLGKRARRGAGAWKIENIVSDNKENTVTYNKESIDEWIKIINPKYAGNTKKQEFPCLKEFEIGNNYNDQTTLRKRIMKTASSCKHINSELFKKYLGNAFGGRLASPIYVSIIENKDNIIPIISKLGFEIPFDRNRSVEKNKVDKENMLKLQNKFINCIINNSDC